MARAARIGLLLLLCAHVVEPYAIPNLTAPHPINASCVLRKLPQPWAARIHFFSYVASDLYHMLAHALRYYRRLGVDFEKRAKFVVHNASGPSVLAKATTYLERYGASYDVSNAWSSAMKRQAANAYLASLPADAWLVYPDLDEFFAFPCELPAVMRNGSFLSGAMVDRVAYDWRLAGLHALPAAAKESREYAIDHQFPRSCALTEKLFQTNAHTSVWKSNLQPDFNLRVFESLTLLRELDESNRFVQKSAESTSN